MIVLILSTFVQALFAEKGQICMRRAKNARSRAGSGVMPHSKVIFNLRFVFYGSKLVYVGGLGMKNVIFENS